VNIRNWYSTFGDIHIVLHSYRI